MDENAAREADIFWVLCWGGGEGPYESVPVVDLQSNVMHLIFKRLANVTGGFACILVTNVSGSSG